MKKELFKDGAKVSRQKANAMLSKWTTGERNCKDSRESAFDAWDRLLSDFGETEIREDELEQARADIKAAFSWLTDVSHIEFGHERDAEIAAGKEAFGGD